MDEYNSFPLTLRDSATGAAISSNVVPIVIGDTTSVLRERARLLALRDIVRMEMPDHPDDLKCTTFWQSALSPPGNFIDYLGTYVPRPIATGLTDGGAPIYVQNQLTARARSLMMRLSSSGVPLPQWDKTNANAELLYLIVEDSELYGSSAIELFGKSEIADTDKDGLNEFVDAFGTPIQWLRWPAGFKGTTRSNPDMLDPSLVDSTNSRLLVNSDPFDRLGSDPGWGTALSPGTGLAPLVVSAGVDKGFGMRFRAIDRYSPSAIAPPNVVGSFGGQSTYSVGDATWANPLYGSTVIFTDPWYPRTDASSAMGAVSVRGSDPPEDNGFIADPTWANDNVSNLDGTAVAL